jgi:hypothetical protein
MNNQNMNKQNMNNQNMNKQNMNNQKYINNFVLYDDRHITNQLVITSLMGLKIDDDHIYKWISYNKFEDKPTQIPKNFHKIDNVDESWITDHRYGPKKHITDWQVDINIIKDTYKDIQRYQIHDNGIVPFIVYIDGTRVWIYMIPENAYYDTGTWSLDYYCEKVESYDCLKIMIGEDTINKRDIPSNKGNTILLKIDEYKYVYIGILVYEFTSEEEILEYHSPIFGSDVAYPVAITDTKIYLFAENIIIKKSEFIESDDLNNPLLLNKDAYTYYYKHKNEMYTHELNFYLIQDRIF